MRLSNASIDQKLNNLLEDLGYEKYLVNPYFRISKSTPEQMKKYTDLNYGFKRLRIVCYLLVSLPISISKFAVFVILSFIFMHQARTFQDRNAKTDYLFLSHGIGQNVVQREIDQFFGSIPAYLSKKNKDVSIIYTNHYLKSYIFNLNLTLLKNDGIFRNLLPKFLKPSENLSYLKTILNPSFICLIKGIKKLGSDPISAYLLIKGSISFYGRETYNNFLLMKRINLLVDENLPKFLVLTFEGHSYEQYLIENMSRNYPKINLVLYQHSPIVPDHYGIKSFLRSNKIEIVIMTTGKKYVEVFSEISTIPLYKLVGSSKVVKSEFKDNNNLSNVVLFAPEGTKRATIDYIKLIRYLCDRQPNFNFRLRLHPHLRPGIVIKAQIKMLNLKRNFALSFNSLYTDLAHCKFVFYRSSAVGIESLMFNATPIFYGKLSEYGLNALNYGLVVQPLVDSPVEALNFLDSSTLPLSKNAKRNIFSQLFVPIKDTELRKVFNIN
jgi:hypothetical protein